MPFFIDQAGREVSITSANRIVSLVPSQTEFLYDLGLRDEVVGITKFCVHPEEWFKTKPKIGGTKQVNLEMIRQLQPDLIIANKEENIKEQVEELAKHYPVWVSDVHTIEEAYEMMALIGIITRKENAAKQIICQVKENFGRLPTQGSRLPAAYLIWKDPYMTIGGDTFIHSMLEKAGFENVFKNRTRYPAIAEADLQICKLILLPSEPYPFQQKHAEEIRAQGITAQVVLVDGEMFSWYGSRMLKTTTYFNKLLAEIKTDR